LFTRIYGIFSGIVRLIRLVCRISRVSGKRVERLKARAAVEFDPDAKVYVIGGVAEDRVTALSDIDILIITSKPISPSESLKLRREILIKAMDSYGLPFEAPVEIHLTDERGAQRYLSMSKKRIEVSPSNSG
jgi:predicted nucleotidyltransferase